MMSRILICIKYLKKLDPDPHESDADPQRWFRDSERYLYLKLAGISALTICRGTGTATKHSIASLNVAVKKSTVMGVHFATFTLLLRKGTLVICCFILSDVYVVLC
jgi:hypothetical protein